MARIVKGAKRYLFFRGKDENGGDILIAMFSKKELDAALKDGRVQEDDNVVKVEVLGRAQLKKSRRAKKR